MTTTSILTLVALAVIALVAPRLLRRIRTPAQKRVPVRGGVLVMRAPRRYAIALGVSALVPAAVLVAMAIRLFLGGRATTVDLVLITVAAFAALVVAAFQFAGAFRKGFVVDEFGVTRMGVLARRRVRWSEVAKVKYNPLNQWFFVTPRTARASGCRSTPTASRTSPRSRSRGSPPRRSPKIPGRARRSPRSVCRPDAPRVRGLPSRHEGAADRRARAPPARRNGADRPASVRGAVRRGPGPFRGRHAPVAESANGFAV